MNINQLEYLIATIDFGSYAGAAKSLYLTPQAVSKGIADLEKELKIALFKKSGRGIEATSAGVLLATKSGEIIQSCEDLRQYAALLRCDDEIHITGRLSAAITSSPYEDAIIPRALFDEFAKQYPGIEMELSYDSSGTCLSALYEDFVDVSIVLGRVKSEQLLCAKLFESEVEIAVDRSHPLATQSSVSLNSLVDYPIEKPPDLRCCRQKIMSNFSRAHLSPHFVDLSLFGERHEHFLKEEQGVIFVLHSASLESRYPSMEFIPLDRDDRISIPVCLVWRRGKNEKLVSLIQKSLAQSLNAYPLSKR
jgi:DNA-binding transcriptional LysR family regulator